MLENKPNETYQEALTGLRVAVSVHQWNDCQKNVSQLLLVISQIDVAYIVTRQIKRFLNDVLNNYPTDEHIIDAISSLEAFTSLPTLLDSAKRIYSVLEIRSNEPGINNFRNALKRLMNSATMRDASDEYIETIVDVLSGILMGILDFEWGNYNRELWNKAFWHTSRNDMFIRVKYFWSDPKIIQLNKELWNEIADDIEVALARRKNTET